MISIAEGSEVPMSPPALSNSRAVFAHLQWLAWRQGEQERMTPMERMSHLARKAQERQFGIGVGFAS